MPDLQIALSESTYSSLHEAARQRSQPVDVLVRDALATFLQASPRQKSISNGEQLIETAGEQRRSKIRAEAAAWRALPETIRGRYGQNYVAVHEGRVVDHDADRLTLYRRVRQRLGNTPVLITSAGVDSPREFYIRSPKLERTL